MHVSGHFADDSSHEDHDVDERVGSLSSPLGKSQHLVSECRAGDICAVAKLGRAETGDTLSDVATTRCSCTRGKCRNRCCPRRSRRARSPTRTSWPRRCRDCWPKTRVSGWSPRRTPASRCCGASGEAHLDVVMDRLANTYGVAVDTVPLRVSLRETFAGTGEATAATSSSPAATDSTACATSRSNLCRREPVSSSSTRSSAAPSLASTSPRSRRASGPRWPAEYRRLPGHRHPSDPGGR